MTNAEIYSQTYWGDAVCTNPIDWGIVYKSVACGGIVPFNVVAENGTDNIVDELGNNIITE